jgi:hypothetical protein
MYIYISYKFYEDLDKLSIQKSLDNTKIVI